MAGTGTFSTYDLTVGTKLSIEDMISLLDPHDAPLHGMFDADGRQSLRNGTATQKKEEWLDDTLLNPRDNAGAAATTSETVLTVGNRLHFTTDDILLVPGGEYVRVTGYGTTANTLLIARAWSGTAGSIASGAEIVGVGTALPEGSDPNDGRYTDRNQRYNLTQIFGPYKLQVSATEQVIDKYGLRSTEMDYQIAKHMKQIAVTIEQAILYGTRVDDAVAERRTMGGFTHFITTNVDAATTDLTEAALRTQLQTIYDAGGRAEWFVVGSTQKSKVSQFAGASSSQIQIDRGSRIRGAVVDYFESDFATVAVMLNRWVRQSDGFLFDADQAEERTLVGRELQFERLGKTGDSEKGQIVTERTLVFRREAHAARFSALAA